MKLFGIFNDQVRIHMWQSIQMIKVNGAMWLIGRRFVFKIVAYMPNRIDIIERQFLDVNPQTATPFLNRCHLF